MVVPNDGITPQCPGQVKLFSLGTLAGDETASESESQIGNTGLDEDSLIQKLFLLSKHSPGQFQAETPAPVSEKREKRRIIRDRYMKIKKGKTGIVRDRYMK